MANKYKISPKSLFAFINEGIYKLPRFQRKDTWKEKQYFELCLSVFQDYPIGSVIVDNDGKNMWLLDGRQRRTCLKKLFEDPSAVYAWAKKVCNIKQTDLDPDVKKKFWNKVEEFLGRELDPPKNKTSNLEDDTYENPDTSPEENEDDENEYIALDTDFSEETKRAMESTSLEILLDYILLSHHKLNKAFDFRCVFTEKKPGYWKKDANNSTVCDPVKLSKFIREVNKDTERATIIASQENFLAYLDSEYDYKADVKNPTAKLSSHLRNHWDDIAKSFDVYQKLDNVFMSAEVGFIELKSKSIADAQNVFSKINSGGTQLNAAELLSAKPYWNKSAIPAQPLIKKIDILYSKLKTDNYNNEEKTYCRWDIVATIISAVDSYNLFFKSVNANPAVTEVDITEIAMGFKLVSSCFVGGMSKLSLDKLEEKSNILEWQDNLSSFIDSMSRMIEAIYKNTYFNVLPDWNCSIYELLGAGATMELIAGAWIRWKNGVYDKAYTSKEFLNFVNAFKNHFDRLILEKIKGLYKGSGDSKMAFNLQNLSERITPITKEEHASWDSIVSETIEGTLNGKVFKHDAMKPLLYYEKIINNTLPYQQSDRTFDIDHIYPKFLFESSNGILDSFYENALCNLALLPSDVNKKKQKKTLNDSSFDDNTKNSISKYEGISTDNFDCFSKAENYIQLKELKSNSIKETFLINRRKYLG